MVTLINVFEMPAEHVDAFVAKWRERAALMTTKPGFVDSRLHRALAEDAKFQLVNVAHWDSAQAMQAAIADPEFQRQINAATSDPRALISSSPALYRVVVEF